MDHDSLSVLVVEDDANMRRTLGDLLELHGFHPRLKATGADALRSVREDGPPAVALVDLRLPDFDGIELIGRLREVSEHTEMVILTGNASVDSAVRAMRERSYDYLTKPVNPKRLVESLGRAGDRWHRRKAEARLAESERRLRSIFGAIVDAVFVTDDEGRIVDANPAAEELTGHSLDGLRTHPLEHFLKERPRGVSAGEWPEAPNGEAREFLLQRPDGERRVVEMRSTGFGRGRSVHSVRDITIRDRLEEQLHRAQRMEAVGQLAGGLAHDFNNVLMAIGGYADLLTGQLEEQPEALEDVNEIIRATERAAQLTQQLLAFSRRQVLKPRLLDPNAILSSMERMLRRMVPEDVELEVDLEPDIGTVQADRAQLEQVIVNLVMNARDAMPEGGRITIRTASGQVTEEQAQKVYYDLAVGDYVVLEVVDTGHGMDAQTLSRAFEPFYSGEDGGPEQGTGLGLAMVYGIIKQSGGYIWAESAPGEGSRFTAYLPRLDEPPEGDQDSDTASVRSLVGSETVLVVDDDRSVREFARRSLERQGYRVLSAAGSDAADVARAHGGTIDLLVADETAARKDAFAERLADGNPSLRLIIASSARDSPAAPKDATTPPSGRTTALPVARRLPKPFSSRELLRSVRRALDED